MPRHSSEIQVLRNTRNRLRIMQGDLEIRLDDLARFEGARVWGGVVTLRHTLQSIKTSIEIIDLMMGPGKENSEDTP